MDIASDWSWETPFSKPVKSRTHDRAQMVELDPIRLRFMATERKVGMMVITPPSLFEAATP
jgi:hypothetical protein